MTFELEWKLESYYAKKKHNRGSPWLKTIVGTSSSIVK